MAAAKQLSPAATAMKARTIADCAKWYVAEGKGYDLKALERLLQSVCEHIPEVWAECEHQLKNTDDGFELESQRMWRGN